MALDELKENKDTVVESEGIKIIYDSDLKEYLDSTVIDYSDNWYNRGFTISTGSMSSC